MAAGPGDPNVPLSIYLLRNKNATPASVSYLSNDNYPLPSPTTGQLTLTNNQQGFMLIGQVSVGSYDTALLFVLAVFVLNVMVALAAFCYFSPDMNPICGRRKQSTATKNRANSEVLMRETVLDDTSDQADIF